MGVVVRQSIKSVIITIAGAVMGMAVTVLSMRYFPQIEYGFTQNLQKITVFLSFFGLFGFNYAVLIQSQHYPRGHPRRNAFLTLCALFPAAFTLLAVVLLFLFKDALISLYNPEDQAMMLRYFITFPLLGILTVGIYWLSSYLQSIQKNALQSMAFEVVLRIGYIALIIAYGFGWINYTLFIYGFLVAYLIPLLYLYFIARKYGGLRLDFRIRFPLAEIKEVFRFSGYHMLTAVSTVLIFQLDAIMLAPIATNGLEAVAVYGVAALAVSLLRGPTRVIATAAVPSFSRHYLDRDLKGLKGLFLRSCVNMQVFALGAFALVLLNMNFIQRVVDMINTGYGEIQYLLAILMLGQVVEMATGFNYQIISISKYYRFNFWISITLLVIVFGLNYILIHDFGMYGAAWATTIGLAVFSVAKSWFVWRKLKMQPFSKSSLFVLLFALIAVAAAWLLPQSGFYYIDLILKNLVFIALFMGLLLRWKVSEDVNAIVRSIIKNKRLF